MSRSKRAAPLPPAVDGVLRRIDRLVPAMVRFTADLCAIDTVNPPGRNYGRCVAALKAKLEAVGLTTRVVNVPKAELKRLVPEHGGRYPRPSLIARWDVGAARTLHMTGHYDVVPPTGGWTRDPFKAAERGRRLYARGSSDMKAADAAAVFAIQAMRQARVTPPWNIELSFTPDEETGGHAGLGWLVHSGAIRPDAAVLLEGASGDRIGYAHRGVLWLLVTVLGRAAHASNPANGVSALGKGRMLLAALDELAVELAGRRTRLATSSGTPKGPTLMPGGLIGGGAGKVNTIPDRFVFSIDRRINPEESIPAAKAEIVSCLRDVCRRDGTFKVRIDELMRVDPGTIAPDHPHARLARKVLRQLVGKPVRFRMTGGFTDMHWLSRDGGVPTVMYGVSGKNAHGDDEYVDIPSIRAAARFYAALAMSMPK
ncbi:MAG: Acetylornithine deacetylase [Phycisphaerae bacterium]|nr:Acetylornithine deacetylase [Phycisphaerae bacterium]